jgi:radical SAM protein with 4Fe4S-binding SPASM domain
MNLATFVIPIVDFILALLRYADPFLLKLRVSKTGYENHRVRHMVGKTGYWLHAYQLTYPNIYKWLKTRDSLFPMAIQVQTINRCNAACSFCPYPYTIHLQEKKTMDDALYSKIVDECVTEPNLHGFVPMSKNEPLLDIKIEQRVKEFKSKAQPHQAVELVTNGSPLTPTRAQRLIDAGVDLITISVNAAREETYNKVMVGLSWKQVIGNLEALSKIELSTVNIYLRFISEQANRADLKLFRKRWKHFNLFTFTVNNRSGTVREYEKMVIHYDDFVQRIKRIVGSRIYPVCPYVFSLVHVLENGDVPMCANDWANRDVLGNVRSQTIREIYNSPRMNEIRALMAQGRFEEIDACRECSFYHEWMEPLEARVAASVGKSRSRESAVS